MSDLDIEQLEREILQDGYTELYKRSLSKISDAIGNGIYPNFKRLDELRLESDKIYQQWQLSYKQP